MELTKKSKETVSRAPERRVFYFDVGNLPKMKAEQYLRDIMNIDWKSI